MMTFCHYLGGYDARSAHEAKEMERVMETGWKLRAMRAMWAWAGTAGR